MRTSVLDGFRRNMSLLNDQLCYELFAGEQARLSFHPRLAKSPEVLVGEGFPENRFASRINVKFGALEELHKCSISFLGGMALVTSVEHLLAYISEVEAFRAVVCPSSGDLIRDEKAEEQLALKLLSWGSAPPVELILTIAYLRLRRNHVAHANRVVHSSLRSAIKDHGHRLEQFWLARPTKLPGLNFSQLDVSLENEDHVFSLISVCRVVMEEVDDLVSGTLHCQLVERVAAERFAKSSVGLIGRSVEVRYRKFQRFFQLKFGAEAGMSAEDFESIWKRSV